MLSYSVLHFADFTVSFTHTGMIVVVIGNLNLADMIGYRLYFFTLL